MTVLLPVKISPLRRQLRALRASRIGRLLNIPRRAWLAATITLPPLATIPGWLLRFRDDTNFTYPLPERSLDYLAHTLALATARPVLEARRYIDEARNDLELADHVIGLARSGPYRAYADARCDLAKRLGWYALVRLLRPEIVVETGVDKGLGSVVLCAALLKNGTGRYYGTDVNPEAGYYLQGRYADVGEILYGDSLATLRGFAPRIGLIINDSDHSADYELAEYRAIADKLAPGAVVAGDNVHVTTKLAEWSVESGRNFLFWREDPGVFWYPGDGLGLSFTAIPAAG